MKIAILGIVLFCGFLLVGCVPDVTQEDCQAGTVVFDSYVLAGADACLTGGEYHPAIAGLRKIQAEGLYEHPYGSDTIGEDEYLYTLTLEGNLTEKEVLLITHTDLAVDALPYKIDTAYAFNYPDICGNILTMGPYNGMVIDPNFEVLTPVIC
jgi:hypothetical protein